VQRSATQTRGTGGFHRPGEDPEVLLDGGEAAIHRIEARQRLGFHSGATRVLGQARDLGVGFWGGGGALNRGRGGGGHLDVRVTPREVSSRWTWAVRWSPRRRRLEGVSATADGGARGGLRWAESDAGLQLLWRKGELG
jgi:hypothetical protein